MDIVRAFTDIGLERGISINIQGTPEDPLFQASQIGKLLGLANIRESIKDFDEDEKDAVSSTDAIGRQQTIQFLTEPGLYRLLGASRKSFARPFQRWVAKVVKEIRLTGKYELEQRLTAKDVEMATQQEAHRIDAKKTMHDALMHANEGTPVVYLAELVGLGELPDGRFLIKFGESDRSRFREPYLRKEYGPIFFTKHYVCTQPHKYEQWLKRQQLFVQRKYTGVINGRRHEEVLAVTPAEYTKVKQFMKKHLHMFDGWTPEQTLEKMRLQAPSKFVEAMAAVASMTDQAARIVAERSVAEYLRNSTSSLMASAPQCPPCKSDDESDDGDGSTALSASSSSSAPTFVPSHATESATAPAAVSATAPAAESATAVPSTESVQVEAEAAVHELFPPPTKKKLGRPAKAKLPPVTDASTPLERFVVECFDASMPDARTHVAVVKARHRLWRASHVTRGETTEMVDFFKARFNVVFEMDEGHDMRSSFYVGLTMRPWVPRVPPPSAPSAPSAPPAADVDAFVREACEVHVMGRARTNDLWAAFVEWKSGGLGDDVPVLDNARFAGLGGDNAERARFMSHMKASFVYHTGVATTKSATGAPGFYGLYLTSATAECREVGYNRSPNTHSAVLKLDARGNVVGVIDSQDVFAHTVAKKSSQHICVELTRCFRDGMRGLILGDGYSYMRAKDHATMLAARQTGS